MPLVDTLAGTIGGLLDRARSPEERRIAICIVDDILEHSAVGAAKYMPLVAPILLEACGDRHAELRQCASYGIKVIAQHRCAP